MLLDPAASHESLQWLVALLVPALGYLAAFAAGAALVAWLMMPRRMLCRCSHPDARCSGCAPGRWRRPSSAGGR